MSEFKKQLEQARRKLLDLTKRNKLINYKKPANSRNLKIIDESAEFIYKHLVFDESPFKFKYIPEPEILELDYKRLTERKDKIEKLQKNTLFEGEQKAAERKIEKIYEELEAQKADALLTAEEQAKRLGFDISSELPDINLTESNIDNKYIDDYLQTLHYPSDLEKILKKIELNARSILEETGTNMLYMILGVLEWTESNHSDVKLKSPLINIPVSLKRGALNKKTNIYEYIIEYTGESIDTNKSLAEKLKNDFNIILPELTEELSFNDYMIEVKKICTEKKNWKIKQEISLDFLQFSKILMYKDLDIEMWDGQLDENEVLNDLFLGKEMAGTSYAPEEYDIDTKLMANEIPLVLDADSSQHSAIIDVLDGKNVVIEGPPGTGKSQTIANMIAALLSDGKSVLFVSEKLAALEVVHKRLSNVELGDFCLELHSHKTQKLKVLESLKYRLEKQYKSPLELNQIRIEIEQKKQELKEYLNVLHSEYGKTNKKIFEVFWLVEKYNESSKFLKFDITQAEELTILQINNTIGELQKYQAYVQNYDFKTFYWNGFQLENLDFVDFEIFLNDMKSLFETYKRLVNYFDELNLELKINIVDEIQSGKNIEKFIPQIEDVMKILNYNISDELIKIEKDLLDNYIEFTTKLCDIRKKNKEIIVEYNTLREDEILFLADFSDDNKRVLELIQSKYKLHKLNEEQIVEYNTLKEDEILFLADFSDDNKRVLELIQNKYKLHKLNEEQIVEYNTLKEDEILFLADFSNDNRKVLELIQNKYKLHKLNEEQIVEYNTLKEDEILFLADFSNDNRKVLELIQNKYKLHKLNEEVIVEYNDLKTNHKEFLITLDNDKIQFIEENFLKSKTYYFSTKENLENALNSKFLKEDILNSIKTELMQAVEILYPELTLSELNKILNLNQNINDVIYSLENMLNNIKKEIGIEIELDIYSLTQLANAIDSFKSINLDLYIYCNNEFGTNKFRTVFTEAQGEFHQIKHMGISLGEIFNIDNIFVDDIDKITSIKNSLEQKKNSFFRFLSSEYKNSKIAYSKILKKSLSSNPDEWIEHLNLLLKFLSKKQQFNKNESFKNILGELYKGYETDWNSLNQLSKWARVIRKNIKIEKILMLLLSGEENLYMDIIPYADKILLQLNNFERFIIECDRIYKSTYLKTLYIHKNDINIIHFNKKLEEISAFFDKFKSSVSHSTINQEISFGKLVAYIDTYYKAEVDYKEEQVKIKDLLFCSVKVDEILDVTSFTTYILSFLEKQTIPLEQLTKQLADTQNNILELNLIDSKILELTERVNNFCNKQIISIEQLTKQLVDTQNNTKALHLIDFEVIELSERVHVFCNKQTIPLEQLTKQLSDTQNNILELDLIDSKVLEIAERVNDFCNKQTISIEQLIQQLADAQNNIKELNLIDFEVIELSERVHIFYNNQTIPLEQLTKQLSDTQNNIYELNLIDSKILELAERVNNFCNKQTILLEQLTKQLGEEFFHNSKQLESHQLILNLHSLNMNDFKFEDLSYYGQLIDLTLKSSLEDSLKSLVLKNFHQTYCILMNIKNDLSLINDIWQNLYHFGTFIEKDFFGENIKYFNQYVNKLEYLSDNEQNLSIWLDFKRLVSKLTGLGCENIVQATETSKLPNDFIVDVYYYNFYNSLLTSAFRKHSLLNNFSRLSHEEVINTFKALDLKLLELNKQLVANKTSQKLIPNSQGGGKVKDFTNLRLIENEISKKKRHIPIRQLVKRAGEAIQSLKPCFMMSPLSVAQYLPPKELKFDVLLIDEASQLKPEEALGVIARTKKIVIVGDPKQLPPTSFFDNMKDDSDDSEDNTVVDEAESILDACIDLYSPIRRLKWHYRSQHETLIDFSNQQFYDNDLIVFPSPSNVHSSELGVKHTYIDNAIYQGGTSQRYNKVEAKILVEHIVKQMKDYPEKTIGIGTFNTSQRDLIQQMIDEKEKSHPHVAHYIIKWKETPESFFVKNLESLQGDERDVIFISTTYGPDKITGQVMQRFGPINQETGWRRLNVLITRSKQKMHVFTSMKSENIKINETSSKGVIALRGFLQFLEMGQLTLKPDITDKGFDSPFEESVYQLLSDAGIKAIPQVGVAGYFIDLAVTSKEDNDFVLAIECDGATYHSSKSARDRDRLKDDVLKKLGWKVYRIWSVDWYKNRQNEIAKLLKTIREQQEIYSEKYKHRKPVTPIEQEVIVKKFLENENVSVIINKNHQENKHTDMQLNQSEYVQKFSSDETIKSLLIELRDTEISKDFTIDKRCILSPMMVDQFIKYKPLDMDEFRNKIPLKLRTSIDREQLVYMDSIFEILEMADE